MKNLLLFNLKVLEFKLKEALIQYEEDKKEINFNLLKMIIDELCTFILQKENQIIFLGEQKKAEINIYVKNIRELATKILGIIEKEEAKKLLENIESYFHYGNNLELTVKQEILDYEMNKYSRILFIGSGSMPITAFTISKEIGAKITCVDIDREALYLSQKVANKLKFDNISFECDLAKLQLKKYSHIIIASLVPLKCNILEDIRKKIPANTKLILRYGNNLKELFNYPICEKEIKKFVKTVIRDRDFIYDTLLLESDAL